MQRRRTLTDTSEGGVVLYDWLRYNQGTISNRRFTIPINKRGEIYRLDFQIYLHTSITDGKEHHILTVRNFNATSNANLAFRFYFNNNTVRIYTGAEKGDGITSGGSSVTASGLTPNAGLYTFMIRVNTSTANGYQWSVNNVWPTSISRHKYCAYIDLNPDTNIKSDIAYGTIMLRDSNLNKYMELKPAMKDGVAGMRDLISGHFQPVGGFYCENNSQ